MIKKLIALAVLIGAIPAGFFLASLLSRTVEDVPKATARHEQRLTVQQLRDFPDFPAFWLGEEFQGLSLTNIQYRRDPGPPDETRPPVEFIAIVYGDCDPEPGSGCPAPLDIITDRPCTNKPSLLAEGARQGPPFEIRGAQAQWGLPGNLFLYTGESTVQIISTVGDEVALEAADALAGVNALGLAHAPSRSAPLPPPVPEDDCEGFVLPDPMAIPTAAPTPIPTQEATQWQ